jgi:drug/metabolite transporter (DMT)-like permease
MDSTAAPAAPLAPPAQRLPLSVLLIAATAAVLFSSKSIFIKLAYAVPGLPGAEPVDAVTLLTLRMLFSVPFFLGVGLWVSRRGGGVPLRGRDHAALVALGLLGYYFSSYMDFIGLKYISASLERLILYLYPTFTVLLSAWLFKKRITARLVAALAVCYCGVALVFGHDLAASTSGSAVWLGAAFVTLSAATYALYLVTGTEVIARVGSTRFTAYAMTVSSLACIAQFFVVNPVERLRLPPVIYGYGMFLGIVSTVLPTFLTAVALKRIGASHVSLIGAVGPISTLALGALILGESINGWQLAGALLVIAGVLSITLKPKTS